MYLDPDGRRCAWGHVDPENTASYGFKTVEDLKRLGVGVAATLSEDDMSWAKDLQFAHDNSDTPERMLGAFKRRALDYGLVWPADVPTELATNP